MTHLSHHKRPPYLTIAVLALAVCALGLMSLRQYQQIQELRNNQIDSRLVLTQVDRIGALNQHSAVLEERSKELNYTLDSLQRNVDNRISQTESQLDRIGQYIIDDADEQESRVIHDLSGSICLIQGEYIFVEPQTGLPLRYVDPPDPVEDDSPIEPAAATVSTEGVGDILKIHFTGTGFLVHSDGYIVTNRHVIEPWSADQTYQHCINAGYQPKVHVLRAFFPELRKPIELTVRAKSPDDDLAIVQCRTNPELPPLAFGSAGSVQPGQTLLILGYPRGLDLLAARLVSPDGNRGTAQLQTQAMQIAENLARLQLIGPLATRGMCGKVAGDRIIYDASTAQGASGSPVVDKQGRVVAVNAALIRDFDGAGFGIPIDKAAQLLETCLNQ